MFDAAPGHVIVVGVGVADLGDRFRLVGTEIDTVQPDEPLPHLPVARAVWTSRPDLRTAATVRAFRDELRWNAAWFHLSRGV